MNKEFRFPFLFLCYRIRIPPVLKIPRHAALILICLYIIEKKVNFRQNKALRNRTTPAINSCVSRFPGARFLAGQ